MYDYTLGVLSGVTHVLRVHQVTPESKTPEFRSMCERERLISFTHSFLCVGLLNFLRISYFNKRIQFYSLISISHQYDTVSVHPRPLTISLPDWALTKKGNFSISSLLKKPSSMSSYYEATFCWLCGSLALANLMASLIFNCSHVSCSEPSSADKRVESLLK